MRISTANLFHFQFFNVTLTLHNNQGQIDTRLYRSTIKKCLMIEWELISSKSGKFFLITYVLMRQRKTKLWQDMYDWNRLCETIHINAYNSDIHLSALFILNGVAVQNVITCVSEIIISRVNEMTSADHSKMWKRLRLSADIDLRIATKQNG